MATKKPALLDSPRARKVVKAMSRANVWIYRRTGGRVGGKWRVMAGFRKPAPVLLLDHVGRTSGRTFTTPLLYMLRGDDVIVVASSGGMAKDPQWYRNLMAGPDTSVQIGQQRRRVRARTAHGDERAQLWRELNEVYADFDTYDEWTDREIPVVVLEPR